MASSVAVRKGRKHKMRLMTDNSDDQMVVKSLSVPPGLETLMEGLTREVLRMQPQDICLFASEHFAKLIKMREASGGEYQFCKTTIHDRIKQKNVVSSRVTTQQNQQPSPKDDVETLDGTPALSAPRLDFGRLTNGVSPEIKRNISEASTAEIDKLQAGFFNSKPEVTKSEEQGNTDDKTKEQEHGTITGIQLEENKTEADDVKNMEPTEHDDGGESSKIDDDGIKEVNEELAKNKENVQSNTGEEDNAKKENEVQEETKDDKANDKEVCENIDKDAVTRESTNEEDNDKQREETSKEEATAHDGCEEQETKNIANEVEPVNKGNEEILDNIPQAKIEHLATAGNEAELNETEKKDSGDNVEDAESKLEATEEHDDLSDSNDVVTQDTEIKTMSPADKVQISAVEENTDEVSSVEEKPVPTNGTEVKPVEDSTEAKLVDENHEGQIEDKSTENETHTGSENAVVNEDVTEKEDIEMDGEHNITKQSVSQADEHEVQSLTIPEISTTVATPTPSEDGSTSADNVAKEFDENVNLTDDETATEEEKQIKAATKLQSLWRGYKLRKMQKSPAVDNADGNEENSAEDLHKLTTAATVIQSLWRGYSFRKSKATENTTPADVEHINSDETSPDKEVRDFKDEQNIAATKIQASWRGHNVRKKRHIDVNDTPSTEEHGKIVGERKPNGEVVENESQDIAKEVMAATVIQALWRGYVTRKSRNLESENESTQRNSDVDIGKLNLAAAKIQSLWRGHNSRKLTRSSRVVAEDEMHAKEMENTSETREHEKAEATDATTAVAESKTDTNITESDKPESEAEKATEVTEQAVEVEKATETESEHTLQSSDSEGNTIVPELGSDKVNDTVEPEIEAEKVSDVESGNIAETTDSEGIVEGVTASPKSNLEDEKTTEEVDSVPKTDADAPELQNETAKSGETSDENNETTENNDEPKSEVQSEGIVEKSELVVKPEETKSEVEDEGEGKSEEVSQTSEPIIKADETEGEEKSEEVAQKAEPIVKADETEDEGKQEVTEKIESTLKADKLEGEVKSEENAEKTEPNVKADETEDEGKQEEVAENIESAVKADKLEDAVKSEEDADKTEPNVKADETEDEGKQEEVTEEAEPAVKTDELEGEAKSEENAEKAEPIVKADETEDEGKQEEVAEKIESAVKADELEGGVKSEDADKTEPSVKADETEGEVKSEEVAEKTEPAVKGEDTESEVKSEEVAEKTEPAVKAEEIVKTDEDERKSEENAEKTEPIVKADETEDDEKQEVAEKIEPAVKADELEGEVKSVEDADKTEPSVKADEEENEVKSEEVAEITEPAVKAEDTEGEVKSEEVSQTSEPVMKADETEAEVKSEVVEPVVKEEVNVETTEPKTKSDEFTETSESVVKPEEIVEATETDGEAKSENITELATPTQSKDISEITENDVKPGEISEPEVNAEEIGEKVEPSVVDETTETGESSVSDKDAHGTINSSTTGGEEVTDLVNPDSTIVEPNEITNQVEAVLKTDEISEATASEAKDTDPEKIVESETDAERNLNEGATAPVSENITQETAEEVEANPAGTENENDTVEKTVLHSDKEINSAGSEVKETEETNAIDSNVKEIDEAKTLSDSEKVSETNENEPAIIPESENIEVKDADVTDKTEAGDNIEISEDSPDNTTITTPSEDTQSEVEHASEITKINDNLSAESSEIAVSDAAAAENKEPERSESTDGGLNEQSTTIAEDSTEEKSTKFDENTGVKPADVIVEDNSEQDKVANSSDNEEKNKDVSVNIDASDTTKTQGTENTESDEKEQIETKENVTETLSPHPLDETQGHVEKIDEITEPEIKKESVEADEASPSNQEESETEITNNIASDKSSEEEKMNETDDKSTNDSIIDIKDDNPSEIEIDNEKTVADLTSVDENKSEDTGANHEAVPATKTAEVDTAEPVSDTIENKEDTSVSADETLQQEAGGQLEETSPNSTDNKLENAESGDKLDDDSEKPVATTNVEHDPKLKEENVSSEVSDSRAEDHKDTYQASEASTVDIRDVEDSLKSPVEAEDSNDLEINVHEDGDKLNESSDTKNSLDADNKVKFYVGPDETNRIQIVDGDAKETDNHVTESDKLAADEVTSEQHSEIHKSVTSVLLSALSNDSEELEKDEATKEMNEEGEHQNDGTNAEENSAENTEDLKANSAENSEDLKENSTERNSGENINATQDNQDQNSIHNNIENHTVKSPENVSNIENDKSDVNHDDDQQKLATNVENFDKALSESENKEKAANNVEVDADNVEDVTHKDDTEDTTSVADTQNASSIPLSHENTENTADTVEENNTATETVNTAPLVEEQHAKNSENKSDSVQNETSNLSPTNLHVEESSESATKDSNDVETIQDSAEGIVTPVEQHENVEVDEATTHTLLNTTAKNMAHKSPSYIIEEGTHDKGNNEHESEETQEELDTPGPTTTEDTEIPHEVENESPVNDEDKHSVDKVDNEPTNIENAIVEDKPHESESPSSASVNDTDENKTVELDETHSPVVTPIEDNQNQQVEHLEEKDTDKNIEENESEKLDDSSVVPSTEDIKDKSNEKSDHLEENINDVKKNSEENEYVAVDNNNSAVEPASQDVSLENKENGQLDTTEDKDAKENINEESPVDKNENALISNKDTHSEVNDVKEANENEDKPDDEINIKDIESQIEHDIADDNADTKQNNGAKENEENNTASEEKEVESSEGHYETSAAVTREDNKTEEDKAAVKIQSAWKGYHVRQGPHEDKELSTLQRPAECDELSSETNVAEDANVLSQAATTIQAGARGYLVRKRRHLAKLTDVPAENTDSTTMDESASVSQETIIEKHATLDTSQSFGSTEIAKSEEDNTHDDTPKEETQPNQEENKLTITPEGSKDVESNTADAGKSKADGEESITECRNDNDVKTECETKDVGNEKANVAESSTEINESIEKHTQKEEETTSQNDEHEELDEIDALNQRLRHLNRSNVYQIDEEKEPNDKVEDDHKTNSPKVNFDRALSDLHAQTSKSLDDDESVMTAPSQTDDSHKEFERNDKHSHEEPDTENKEDPKANTTPRLSVNLDDFDSAKYDLKVEHATPRSKNTSPVHELTSAAYKIGAAIAVDSEAIVDAMDENVKDKSEAKPVEYIHIPLQGPLPEKIEEKPIEKETLKASQEHETFGKNKDDGESPEYIYIPLKPPGTVDEEDEKADEGSLLKENMGDVDNQKEDVKNETDTSTQSPGENKDDNKDNLKEKLLVSEPAEEKEDSADTRTVLENKAKEDNNSYDLSGKEDADAKEIHESTANHGIEEESDNETKQITKLPEPIPLMSNSSEFLSEAKSTQPDGLESKTPEPAHSEKLIEESAELSESQPTHSVLSEEPIEKVTAKENLEKSSASETKTPEPELSEIKSTDSTLSGQSTEHLTTEDKSVIEHTSAEPELSGNKSSETVLSDTKASDDKPKSPEAVNSEQVEKSKDETSHSPSLGKSTSPIDDIDAFLQRNKSRTISRQAHVDASSHRTLFAEIDSLIDAYGQKRQMSPTSNDHPDLAAAKIDNESRAQGQQLSVQDDLPDVIMANSNGADRAATKIQSAFRGYHTRQQLLKEGANRLDEVQPRKGSQESDKTYTIDKRNGSTPDDEVPSDDDEMKNKAAAKIQTTFREYRKKGSIEHGKSKSEGEENHANETSKDDENMEKSSIEQSSKVEEEPCPDETSEQEDQNKELKVSIENSENQQHSQDTTSVVDVKDESEQENTSPSVSVNTSAETTIHNTDEEETVTKENPPDNSEVQQSHAADYDSLNSQPEKQHSPEVGLVQDLKITKLEDKFLDHVVTNDSGTDAKHEQLRDISEITHGAATKIQSTYRGFKTRQTLKNNNQVDGSLETIPEVTSPTSQHRDHATGDDEQTINEEEHIPACTNGTVAQPPVRSGADVDDSSRPNSTTTVQKYKPTGDVVASTSDDWRYQLLQDATTDAESTVKDDTSSDRRTDEDDSEPYADSKLVQGYHHNQQHGAHHQQQAEQPRAGLQHSGEMHDTLDIFLSSEELSQGAEVLTSRDKSTTDDVSGARAQCESAAKHEAAEQHDDHSVMESAKHQSNKNNTPTTPHNHQQQQHQQHHQQQQQQTGADMGNDEAVAATKIQAGFRGYQVRKQMKLKKNGSDDAKMVKRCSSGRRRGSLRRGDNSKSGTDLEERSATKIQAGIRGFLVRKRQKSTKDKQ